MKSGIYSITCKPNNKVYIGYTKDIKKRRGEHFVALRKGKHVNTYLQEDWQNYGESMFKFERIEICDRSVLAEREDYWCKLLHVHKSEYGYNIARTDPSNKKYKRELVIENELINKSKRVYDKKEIVYAKRTEKIKWRETIPQIIEWIKEGKTRKDVAILLQINNEKLVTMQLKKYRNKGLDIPFFSVWWEVPEVAERVAIKRKEQVAKRRIKKYNTVEERNAARKIYNKKYCKQYYQENKEKSLQQSKKYKRKHPEKRVLEKLKHIQRLRKESKLRNKDVEYEGYKIGDRVQWKNGNGRWDRCGIIESIEIKDTKPIKIVPDISSGKIKYIAIKSPTRIRKEINSTPVKLETVI